MTATPPQDAEGHFLFDFATDPQYRPTRADTKRVTVREHARRVKVKGADHAGQGGTPKADEGRRDRKRRPAKDPGGRPSARRTDPDTSHAAAGSVTADALLGTQVAVLRVLAAAHRPPWSGGMTDEQLVAEYALQVSAGHAPKAAPSGVRTRRRELADMGLVQYAGTTRTLTTGRQGRVWQVTEAGSTELERL